MADSFGDVHVKGTDEIHDFIDSRGLKKSGWNCTLFQKSFRMLIRLQWDVIR